MRAAGCGSVARLLQDTDTYTCTVDQLDLRGNSIGVEGCRAICKAMTTNVSVRALNLNNNPVSNEGGMAVAEMLYVRTRHVEDRSTHEAAAPGLCSWQGSA